MLCTPAPFSHISILYTVAGVRAVVRSSVNHCHYPQNSFTKGRKRSATSHYSPCWIPRAATWWVLLPPDGPIVHAGRHLVLHICQALVPREKPLQLCYKLQRQNDTRQEKYMHRGGPYYLHASPQCQPSTCTTVHVLGYTHYGQPGAYTPYVSHIHIHMHHAESHPSLEIPPREDCLRSVLRHGSIRWNRQQRWRARTRATLPRLDLPCHAYLCFHMAAKLRRAAATALTCREPDLPQQ